MRHWLDSIRPQPWVVGHAPADGRWIEPRRVIYDHELVLFVGGDYRLEIAGQTLDCPRDSFAIVPPGQPHVSWAIAGGRKYHRYWVHFDWLAQGERPAGPLFTFHPAPPRRELIRPAPASVPPPTCRQGPIAAPGRVLDLFDRLHSRWNHGSAHDRRTCGALLLELLLELLDEQNPLEPAEEGRDTRLLSKARRFLDAVASLPLRDAPSVQAGLTGLGRSYAHLCRSFRTAYGVTPLDYVTLARLERGRRLLQDTDLTVAEIARRVGFDDAGYFIRRFRRAYGLSPGRFARSPERIKRLIRRKRA